MLVEMWKENAGVLQPTTTVYVSLAVEKVLIPRTRAIGSYLVHVGRCGTGVVIRKAQGSQELYLAGF